MAAAIGSSLRRLMRGENWNASERTGTHASKLVTIY